MNIARSFYDGLFGFDVLFEDGRTVAYGVARQQVLLLFAQGASATAVRLPGGVIPPHDGSGRIHVGFSVSYSDYEDWRTRLEELHIAVESEVQWPLGGMSLYFRDPDGHLLELLTPGVWAIR